MEALSTELEVINRSNVMEGVFFEQSDVRELALDPVVQTDAGEKADLRPNSAPDSPTVVEVPSTLKEDEKPKNKYLTYGLIAVGALAVFFLIRALIK